jgi:hypothetical protein
MLINGPCKEKLSEPQGISVHVPRSPRLVVLYRWYQGTYQYELYFSLVQNELLSRLIWYTSEKKWPRKGLETSVSSQEIFQEVGPDVIFSEKCKAKEPNPVEFKFLFL